MSVGRNDLNEENVIYDISSQTPDQTIALGKDLHARLRDLLNSPENKAHFSSNTLNEVQQRLKDDFAEDGFSDAVDYEKAQQLKEFVARVEAEIKRNKNTAAVASDSNYIPAANSPSNGRRFLKYAGIGAAIAVTVIAAAVVIMMTGGIGTGLIAAGLALTSKAFALAGISAGLPAVIAGAAGVLATAATTVGGFFGWVTKRIRDAVKKKDQVVIVSQQPAANTMNHGAQKPEANSTNRIGMGLTTKAIEIPKNNNSATVTQHNSPDASDIGFTTVEQIERKIAEKFVKENPKFPPNNCFLSLFDKPKWVNKYVTQWLSNETDRKELQKTAALFFHENEKKLEKIDSNERKELYQKYQVAGLAESVFGMSPVIKHP